ncbi:MAG: MlaD family protein [Rubrivivax sp.]
MSAMKALRGIRGGAAWRVGLFTLVGLALLALAVVLAGGHWFVPREAALLRFRTSVYGLQVGAPVVFRGVRVGQVTAVGPGAGRARWHRDSGEDRIRARAAAQPARPVSRSVGGGGQRQRRRLAGVAGARARGQARDASLLTGQLYVDLDLDPARAGAIRAQQAGDPEAAAAAGALPVIPTAPSQLQSLQAQLEGLDLGQIGRDLSTPPLPRQVLAGPESPRAW